MKVLVAIVAFVAFFAMTYAMPQGSASSGEGILYPVIKGGLCKTVGDQQPSLIPSGQTCTCMNATILFIIPVHTWGNCTVTPTTTTTAAPPTTSSVAPSTSSTSAPSTSSTASPSTSSTFAPSTSSTAEPSTSSVPSTTVG